MDWLQTLLDNSSTPVWTAFLLGLLTALSPCPLATNIAAIGFIGKDIENRRRIFWNGLLYTLGRILSYALLGVVLILVLKEGSMLKVIRFLERVALVSQSLTYYALIRLTLLHTLVLIFQSWKEILRECVATSLSSSQTLEQVKVFRM